MEFESLERSQDEKHPAQTHKHKHVVCLRRGELEAFLNNYISSCVGLGQKSCWESLGGIDITTPILAYDVPAIQSQGKR